MTPSKSGRTTCLAAVLATCCAASDPAPQRPPASTLQTTDPASGARIAVSDDGRSVIATGPNGAPQWSSDVVAVCGGGGAAAMSFGDARIRSISVAHGMVLVALGRHDDANVDLRTGAVTCRLAQPP